MLNVMSFNLFIYFIIFFKCKNPGFDNWTAYNKKGVVDDFICPKRNITYLSNEYVTTEAIRP